MFGFTATYTTILILLGAVVLTVGLYVAFVEGVRWLIGIELPTAVRFRFGLMLSGLPVLAVLERDTLLEAASGPRWQTVVLGCLAVVFVCGVTLVGLMLFRFGDSS